ncbi:MAG: protein kinase [Acidobacteriota bacterium]
MPTRLARLGVLVVAAAFAGYWALLVSCDLWRPLPPGLVLNFDGGRVAIVDVVPGSGAARAGLQPGDLLSAPGQSINGRLHWMAIGANFETGRPAALLIDRGGRSLTATFTPEQESWGMWRARHGPALLVIRLIQFVTLLLALFVALKRPHDPIALAGAMLLATIGVFSLTLPLQLASRWRALPPPAGWLLWIPFISSAALAGWGLSFFTIFPRSRFRTRLAWLSIWVPLAPGLIGQAVFGYQMVVQRRPPPPLPPWPEALIAVSIVYAVASVVVLVRNYGRLTDVNQRRRVRVLMLGMLVGSAAGIPVVVSYWRASTSDVGESFLASPFATLGTFLFLALPLSFAYAILRHRLFDIRVLIRQGLRYALARRALLALVPVLLVALGVDVLAHGAEPVGDVLRSRGWIYLAVGGLVAVARSQRQDWLDGLDRRFFRERYNAQRLLRQIADDVRQAASLELAAPAIVSRIEQALHATFVALLVRDASGRRYRTVASFPPGAAPQAMSADNRVLALARLVAGPLAVAGSETGWLARKLPVADVRTMRDAAIELIVPIGAESSGGALFVLGSKRSEEPYTEDDGELLMAIGDGIATRLTALGAGEVRPAQAVSDSGPEGFEECPVCGVCYESGTGRCAEDGEWLAAVAVPRLLGGRYALERRLGRGGMGTVYAALDSSLDRRVAAKIIRVDLIGLPGVAERFRTEARVAAAFAHPNVVTVHDFGVAGGHAFLVMELLTGRTLRETLRAEHRLDPRRTLQLVGDVTAAIEAAHARQLIHRDLKPENVCLVSHGTREVAKVLDFGIARFLSGADRDQVTTLGPGGALVGTPLYMAPEQLRGEGPEPGWDLWALAVMTFELLTGSHPFAAVAVGRPAPTSAGADLPVECRIFLASALAIDRAVRPSTPAAFLAGLKRSLVDT